MSTEIDYQTLDTILESSNYSSKNIITILQDTQEVYNYLPEAVFGYYSDKLNMSEARIYSVATFYENFSLDPKGKYIIKICDGTACHVRHSIPILERLREELNLSEGEITTPDLGFTVETVSCLGACGLAPVITINEKVYGAMTPEKASELLDGLKEEFKNAQV